MSKEHKLTAYSRKDEGKGASRRLRHAGRIPAVIYGGESAPQSIELEQEPTWLAQQNDWFYSSIIDISVDDKEERVLLRDMQRHPYKQIIMHLDFQRVVKGQKLHANVPLHFINIDSSPAGKSADATVTSEMNDVAIVCLPRHLPEFIEVDLGTMAVGDTFTLSQLVLPEGVELAHAPSEDNDPALAVARFARVQSDDEEAAQEAGDVPAAKQEDAE